MRMTDLSLVFPLIAGASAGLGVLGAAGGLLSASMDGHGYLGEMFKCAAIGAAFPPLAATAVGAGLLAAQITANAFGVS
jgi:hypothetical protein